MDKTYRDKTNLRQNVSGQNVSAPKVSPTERIGYKMYRRHNVSSTKGIGGQNVSADKTYRRTKRIGGQNVSADYRKTWTNSYIFWLNFKGTPIQVVHQTVFRSQSRTGTWTWTRKRTGIQTRTWAQTHGHAHGHEHGHGQGYGHLTHLESFNFIYYFF